MKLKSKKMESNNLTELVFILDRSGSMSVLEGDTMGGFNSMIARQKREEGRALVSTVLFNTESEVIHDRLDVRSVPPMTRKEYQPAGCTALLDAMGDAIRHIRNVHKYARKEDVPQRTLFVITTDGLENASHRYSAEKVREMIEYQKKKHGWEFLFLGANIDAVQTARDYGIDEDMAVDFCFDSVGMQKNYDAVCCAVSDVREGKKLTSSWKKAVAADYQMRGR